MPTKFTFNPNCPNPPEVAGTQMADWMFSTSIVHPETQVPVAFKFEPVSPWTLARLVEVGCDEITIERI